MEKEMTYRESIQELIRQIHHIYDAAEPLRDCAFRDQQKYWNDVRRIFYDAAQPLRKLDNELTATEATSKVSNYAEYHTKGGQL
jgi:hypothetical protein